MFMRRVRYNSQALFGRDGVYWYSRGWNWRAIGAFALGIGGALLFANAPLYQGPLIGVTGNGDISIYVGFVVSAVAYYLLMRGTIRSQSAALTVLADSRIRQSQAASVSEAEGTAL
jgi:cytosine/uracil/thiamine/allantoin permease